MRYQVGGSLRWDDPTYITRYADEQLYSSLKMGEFCYVLNARQMGKTSLLQRTCYRLEQENYRCAYLDSTQLGSEKITPLQWYKGIIFRLFQEFNWDNQVDFKDWCSKYADLPPAQQLHQFVECLLLSTVKSDRLFIFIDEIDSLLSLPFCVDDFFAWIRHCYNLRSQNPAFERLSFALFGVASPSDLITDKRRTPFNIGQAIALSGFQYQEAQPLLNGLGAVINQPERILREILHWTGGQPFLTQKICRLVQQTAQTGKILLPLAQEKAWLEQLVQQHLITHWESQDEPEHLRTIRNRLLVNERRAGRLLGLYQKILASEDSYFSVATDDSQDQTELLLSGLIEKDKGHLRLKNPIYRQVFDLEWVLQQLDSHRPYSQALNTWIFSNCQDKSRLLQGQALRDAQRWTQNKSLSDIDYQFLAASQAWEQKNMRIALEAERAKEAEAKLEEQRKTAIFQRLLLIALGIKLILALGLGFGIALLYYQSLKSETKARISEIKALVSSSEGLFASHRRLDALIQAIKAQKRLQQLSARPPHLESQIKAVLEQAVYGADEYNRFLGHQAAVLAVAVSPDNSLIASASVDQTVKIWREDGTPVTTLQGHTAVVRAVAFSPNGELLVSGGDDGQMILWKKTDSKQIYHFWRKIPAHQSGIWGLAVSQDGQTIASASFDKTVKLWQMDGTLLNTLQGYAAGFWGVAFSPDGQIVAATNVDRTVKIWKKVGNSWNKAKFWQLLRGHQGWVAGIAFSPDGRTLVTSSEDKTVKLWRKNNVNEQYSLFKTLTGHSAAIWGVSMSPDGQTLASASLDKTIKLWNIEGTELRTLSGHPTSVWDVTFSADGRFIVSGGAENEVKLWQAENPFQKTVIAHQTGIWSVEISADSEMIATVSHEKGVKLWDRSGQLQRVFLSQQATISGVSFSQNDSLIAFADEGNHLYVNKLDGTPIETLKEPNPSLFTTAFSPNGQTFAIANTDKNIILLPRPGNLPRKILKGHQSDIWNLVFSPDSQYLASASGDGTAKLWHLKGNLEQTLVGHTSAVWRVAFSRDGQQIATGSGDKTVKVWTLDGKVINTLKGHKAAVWGVAFSPDGKIIASGSVDTSVKLWQLDGTEITTLTGHTAAIRSIAMSPDGTFLASVGDDNTLILWNLPKILASDPLTYACQLVSPYLKTNPALEEDDRLICDD